MSGPKIFPPEFEKREIVHALRDWEILLSFQDEEDAADFVRWWNEIGESDYTVTVARRRPDWRATPASAGAPEKEEPKR